MEAEIIPMCEDQGMAVVPWAALGGGLLLSAEQRRQREENLAGQKSFYDIGPKEIAISDALEKIAISKGTNVQAIVGLPTLPVLPLPPKPLLMCCRPSHISTTKQPT
jgi:aryl-alcohol dehydrogenase-like predicted oxidoreductase